MKIGYLGPEESYTHIAARKAFIANKNAEYLKYLSISEVIEKLEANEIDAGIVPIENSVEGSVNETMDALLNAEGIYITNEYIMPIRHCLLNKAGSEIEKIYAHPQTFAQCRNYLKEKYPKAQLENASSNSAATEYIAGEDNNRLAAIAAKSSAEAYGLQLIDKDINDEPNNETRFYILTKSPSAPTGKDKTTLVFVIKDEPGTLINVLKHFAELNINLSKIESRPSKKQLGEYIFYVDLDIHKEDDKYTEALKHVRLNLSYHRWLGSYSLID